MSGGVHYDTLFDLSDPYVTVVSTWGRSATPMSEAIVQPPLPLPVAIVNKYPLNFNYDDTPSDDRVKDKTILADDIVPVDHGGVPTLPADPISDKAFHKGLAAIRARCNAMMATIEASNQITCQHHNVLLTHRDRLDQADAAHASIQVDLAHLAASFTMDTLVDSHVTKLVTNVTSLDTRLALVESQLAQVVTLSDLASTRVADTTTNLDTHLSVLDSTMSALTQQLPSSGHQSRAPTVMPSPLDTSPTPPAPPANTPDTMGPALLGSRGDSATAGNVGGTMEDSTGSTGATSVVQGEVYAESAPSPNACSGVHWSPPDRLPPSRWPNVNPSSFARLIHTCHIVFIMVGQRPHLNVHMTMFLLPITL
jgi:hypothetical protein